MALKLLYNKNQIMDSHKELKYSDADVEHIINSVLSGTNHNVMALPIIEAFKNLHSDELSQKEDPYFHLRDGNYIGGLTMPKK
jgi:hypothetical protein